jgi:hypothetical protein
VTCKSSDWACVVPEDPCGHLRRGSSRPDSSSERMPTAALLTADGSTLFGPADRGGFFCSTYLNTRKMLQRKTRWSEWTENVKLRGRPPKGQPEEGRRLLIGSAPPQPWISGAAFNPDSGATAEAPVGSRRTVRVPSVAHKPIAPRPIAYRLITHRMDAPLCRHTGAPHRTLRIAVCSQPFSPLVLGKIPQRILCMEKRILRLKPALLR